ncbi:hypothetical protein OESDEN_05039, partial [Oesophagostomum dentatum]
FRNPISLYVPLDSSKPQYRRLVFRNNSITDIVVKLVPSKPDVVEFARDRLRLLPSGSLFIEIKINYANVGTFDYLSPRIFGYAMPVYAHTLPKIAAWLNTPGMETAKQLAFEVLVKFNNDVFSARDTIIDLPGSACLVEAIPRSIPIERKDAPVDTGDSDTLTAVKFTQDEVITTSQKAEKSESCWFSFLSSTYKPLSNKVSDVSQKEQHIRTVSDVTANPISTAAEQAAENVNVELDATPCGGG